MSRPTPWPTSERTTEKPASSVTVWIACETSDRCAPERAFSIPAQSAASQVSRSLSASPSTSPTLYV